MTKNVRDEKVRKQRIPVASSRAPLIYRGLDTKNFHHRWVHDIDDRIARFLEGGYEFIVQTAQGTFVGDPTVDSSSGLDSRVSKAAGGASTKRLYLMRIPIEWYEEDQAVQQREIDELEDTMRTPTKGKAVNENVDYGKISMTRKSLKDVLKTQDD